jgi:hypothetical protein
MKDDRLESLLRSAGNSEPLSPNPAPNFTERVLRAATRRQQRRRRGLIATGLVSCYLGGMLTMWLCLPAASTRTNLATQVAREPMESSPETLPAPVLDNRVGPQIERRVETAVVVPSHQDAPTTQKTLYELFRDLGDASHARSDFSSAVRHYRTALDFASEADFQIPGEQDNFLLLSLKQDRIESTLRQSPGKSI